MNNELAKLIKTSRIKNQLSQRELAKKMKVSNTIISRIESGMVKKPSLEIIIKLSNELKIEFHNLAKISGYSNDEIFPIITSEVEYATTIVGEDKINNYIIKTEYGIKLDICKILDNYKRGLIDRTQAIELIFVCQPLYLNDKIYFPTYKGEIIIDDIF